jgi:hypothetical protein
LRYLESDDSFPEFVIIPVNLPEIDGVKAGFSGVDINMKTGEIIFTASVENTADTYNDGEILGSFVGIIDPKKLVNGYKPFCVPVKKHDDILKIKVESVTLLKSKNYKYKIMLVTDSDGGVSEILKGNLINKTFRMNKLKNGFKFQ